MNPLIYLYGYTPAGGPVPDLAGVAGARVERVDCGGVAALVSRVPAAEFSAGAIEARLDDLDWVGRRGLEHERVVAWLVDRGTILPVRLFTLFSGLDALRADCAERGEWIADQLHRLHGLREWDLKVSADLRRFAAHVGEHSQEIAGLDRELESAPPGRQYLLRRKRDDAAQREARRVAVAVAESLLDELAPLARRSRRLEAPRAAGAADLPVILNAAFLLDRGAEEAMRQEVQRQEERLREEGFTIAYTGPWAPYRFVDGEA